MTQFYTDFENLMRKGFYLYVESDSEDGTIHLEAKDEKDDSHIITASYTAEGERLTCTETSFIKQMKNLIK